MLYLIIQSVYWIIDRIKIKKDILDTKKEIKELEVSIKSLRTTNHKILNSINELQLKSYYNKNLNISYENNNKAN